MQYYKRGTGIDPEKHNIGKSPNSTALNDARANLLHHISYSKNRELLNYSGCPEGREIDAGVTESISGDFDCSFYIIFPNRGLSGDKIKIGYSLTTWDWYDATGNCNFQWDGVQSVKLANTKVTASTDQTDSESTAGLYQVPKGIAVTDEIEIDYDYANAGSWEYSVIEVSFEHLLPASFVSWIRPQDEPDYNSQDPTYASQAYNMSDSGFNIGQALRGSNSNTDTNGSVGTLCQRQFNDNVFMSPNMISSSDLCLFQWGHPSGLYVEGATSSLQATDILPYNIKIKGRELTEAGSGYFDMIVTYRADAGTYINVLVDSTSTLTAKALTTTTGTTPTTTVAFVQIPFDGSGDELTISCTVSDSLAVEIKTIAIFERSY